MFRTCLSLFFLFLFCFELIYNLYLRISFALEAENVNVYAYYNVPFHILCLVHKLIYNIYVTER